MRRRFTLLAGTCAVALTAAAPAVAGAPGTNFPEQPNGHVATACAHVLTNAGNGATGAATLHESATAGAIKFALASDACPGG
jgi:hypothetical protein